MLSYLKTNFFKWRFLAIFIVSSILVSEVVVELLKNIFNRPRPRDIIFFNGDYSFIKLWAIGEYGLSFPSSHSKSGFIFVLLFYIFYSYRKSLALLGLCFSFLLGIVLSVTRIAQGGHFLSDVFFSFVGSHLVVLILFFLLKKLDFKFQTPTKIKFILFYLLIVVMPMLSIILYFNKFF